ncbi:MAG: hypothetical protein Q8R83_02330 [Legionellaceae bacterium]|nr:hypothetical protein [Legionellaceae bacterium]
MPNYYNYISGEAEDINTAEAFYVICLNPELQTYKFVASPQDLNILKSDPETRAESYWPITREQIDSAPQDQIFNDDNIRNAPLSLAQIQNCFGFNPQTVPSSQFRGPVPTIGFGLNLRYLTEQNSDRLQRVREQRIRELANDSQWYCAEARVFCILFCIAPLVNCVSNCTRTIATIIQGGMDLSFNINNTVTTLDELESDQEDSNTHSPMHR